MNPEMVNSRARENSARDNIFFDEDLGDDDDEDDDDHHQFDSYEDDRPKFIRKGDHPPPQPADQGQVYSCNHSHKASQTCFCAQQKGLNGSENKFFVRLTDLREEDEEYEAHDADQNLKLDQSQNNPRSSNFLKLAPDTTQEPSDPYQQIRLLREMLRLERENGEKRHKNNLAMQEYVQQLQLDFLRQQREQVEILEISNKLKTQKDSQISIIEATIVEKNRLIEQLRSQLNDLDEAKLRDQIKKTLEQQQSLAKIEEDQLKQQLSHMGQQLAHEKVDNDEKMRRLQEKLNDQMQSCERELQRTQSSLVQSQRELERLLEQPQNLIIKTLKEDKAKLQRQIDESNISLSDYQAKYASIKKNLENLLEEQRQFELKNHEQFEKLHGTVAGQRHTISEFQMNLEDKQETIQVLQFNLQRSEKRTKNLLGVLKNKEEVYRQLIERTELKYQQDLDKLTGEVNSLQRQLAENGPELTKKQNELVKLRLEHENQLDSIRTDRDERINKCLLDKQNLEKELRSIELRFARESELASSRLKQNEQLQKEVSQFKEESKRLLIELTQRDVKLHSKQREIEELQARHKNVKGCNEQTGYESNRKRIEQFKTDLEEEKRLSNRYKTQLEGSRKDHEKMCVKLRIAETNLIKMTSSINREHARMLRDYEKKIEQIRLDRTQFDRNRLRYRRHGYNLKKYCEHLKSAHAHICNPKVCGYSADTNRYDETEKKLLIDDNIDSSQCDDSDCDCLKDLESCVCLNYSSGGLNCCADSSSDLPNCKIDDLIRTMPKMKRTGVKSAKSVPNLNRSQNKKLSENKTSEVSGSFRHLATRKPLKSVSQNTMKRSRQQEQESKLVEDEQQHDYCYINESFY